MRAVAETVLQERVFAHFSALGWTLADETTVGEGPTAFHPDLVLEHGIERMAVRISEERLGTYQIGLFGAQCRRAKTAGLVVCESSPEVLEACEAARLEFVSAENVGEPIVVPITTPRAIRAEAVEEAPVAFEQFAPTSSKTPWWRWVLVAAIWVAAIVTTAYWLTLVF